MPQVAQPYRRSDSLSSSSSSDSSSLGYLSPPITPPMGSAPHSKYHDLFMHTSCGDWTPEKRIEQNSRYILESSNEIKKTLEKSYLFEKGEQVEDPRLKKIFLEYYGEMHGGEKLTERCAKRLAYDCSGYKDASRVEKQIIPGGDYDDIKFTFYYPTKGLIDELNGILDREYGLQKQFLCSLKNNEKKISSAEEVHLKAQDHWTSTLPKNHPYKQNAAFYFPLAALSRLFPKCLEALHKVFQELLIIEWFRKDIEEIKVYLKKTAGPKRAPKYPPSGEELTRAIERWEEAKYHGEQQRKKDERLKKKNWSDFKDDCCHVAVSAGVSYATANPFFVMGQTARAVMNQTVNSLDPEREDKVLQTLKLFGGVGVGGVFGGNARDIVTALGIDLIDLATKAEKTTSQETTLRNLGSSILKGILTKDKKKFLCEILRGVVSEAANQLPETNEESNLEDRIFRALLTNSDMQSYYIGKYVDQRFTVAEEETSAKRVQETKAENVQQVEDLDKIIAVGQEHVQMEDEGRYLRLVEEQKQNNLELEQAKTELDARREATQKAAKKEEKLHKENKKTRLIPKPKLYEKWQKSQKVLGERIQEQQQVETRINALETKIYENEKGQIESSLPKEITTDADKTVLNALQDLNRKEEQAQKSRYRLEGSIKTYQEHGKKDRDHHKLKKTIKTHNSDIQERDAALNTLGHLLGSEETITTPKIDVPKKAATLEKVLIWANKNVGVSSHEMPKPLNYDPEKPVALPSQNRASYQETRHQIGIENSELRKTEAPPQKSSQHRWSTIEHQQEQKMLKINMDYTSPSTPSSFSSGPIDYAGTIGPGLASRAQLPPKSHDPMKLNKLALSKGTKTAPEIKKPSFSGFLEFTMAETEIRSKQRVDNDFIKSIPKGVGKVARGATSLMLPDLSKTGAECPKEHFNRACLILSDKYDKLMEIKDPNSLAAKSGSLVGEMMVFSSAGKVIGVANGALSRSTFMLASEGGLAGAVMAEAHHTDPVAGAVLGFGVGGAAGSLPVLFRALKNPTPLQDKILGLSMHGDSASMQSVTNHVLKCGFVGEKTVGRLAEREVAHIQLFKMPYVKKGPELEWWKGASVKVDRFKRMTLDEKELYKIVRREFSGNNLSELQVRRVLKYAGFQSFENPKYFPTEYVVEFAKKNAGIVFRKPGTVYEENILIRICPGLGKENFVSGEFKNGTLRQQKPYVVQCKGNLKLTIDGRWVRSDALNKENQALTHLPLETYNFNGW